MDFQFLMNTKQLILAPVKYFGFACLLEPTPTTSWCLMVLYVFLEQKKNGKMIQSCHAIWYKIAINKTTCWHRFLTRIKGGDFYEEKVTDLEEIKRCTVLESADGVRPMGQKNMLWKYWSASSGIRPMESCRWSQRRKRGSGLYENLDDSIVVFKIVHL